ncbi:MAG: TonB-dependent receptor, partial [Bacteroidales bacterium]|nr:TonB-dependent receptor [Bacteroidales bacterium]
YYTLDIVSRFRIDDQFQVSLNINNVFNSHYGGIDAYGGFNDLIYNPQYGRSILFGLSYSLE